MNDQKFRPGDLFSIKPSFEHARVWCELSIFQPKIVDDYYVEIFPGKTICQFIEYTDDYRGKFLILDRQIVAYLSKYYVDKYGFLL
jgi:hypothetical protein